jgi:hypothetical protein
MKRTETCSRSNKLSTQPVLSLSVFPKPDAAELGEFVNETRVLVVGKAKQC